MTTHEEFIASLRAKAKAAGQPLGPQAQAATQRPANFCELGEESRWAIDKRLGILDWDGEWNT